MEQKTIKKDFIKIDEENFTVVETRETTTDVNEKKVNLELKTFRSNLKQDITTIIKNINAVKIGCDKFNSVLVDLQKAKDELGLDIAILEPISYDGLEKEIIDDEIAIKAQQEKKEEVQEEVVETSSENNDG